ncbi:MAG TPA: SDR family oxidoreductase [Silvibacterium sp.]|nr:SDR family oxidoreductase [Silvibacterium sp.]
MKSTGNTILVTGGGSGIGRAYAEAFLKLGNRVIIAGRRKQVLDEVVAANPGMESAVLDVEDGASIKPSAEALVKRFPKLNVVFHSAGIMRPENLLSGDDLATAEATISTNLLGTIRLTTALLPEILKQPDGAVLTISSGLAFTPLHLTPTYCATKAAIHSFSQSLRYQLRNSKVSVIEIIPPYLQTALMGQAQAKDPRAMPLADFISETMSIIQTQPDVAEVIVEKAKFLRFAEQDGPEKYNAFFKSFNEAMMAPH